MEKVLFKKLYLKSIRTVREGLWHLSYNPLLPSPLQAQKDGSST